MHGPLVNAHSSGGMLHLRMNGMWDLEDPPCSSGILSIFDLRRPRIARAEFVEP